MASIAHTARLFKGQVYGQFDKMYGVLLVANFNQMSLGTFYISSLFSFLVLIEGTKKAIFLLPSPAEDCLSKTDIGTQQSCSATSPKTI